MTVPVTGGASTPFGPPDFGRLNDLHLHVTVLNASGGMVINMPRGQC